MIKAFDAVHMEQASVTRVQVAVRQKMKKRRPARLRKFAAAVCVLTFAVLGVTGYRMYETPVAAVCIEGTDPVELEINCFGRVVQAANSEGELAEYCHLGYSEAVSSILSAQEEDTIQVSVLTDDPDTGNRIQEKLVSCAREQQVALSCETGNYTEYQQAAEAGLPLAKYRAFLELKALDPSVTAEEVSGWSMREIREKIEEAKSAASDQEEIFPPAEASNSGSSAEMTGSVPSRGDPEKGTASGATGSGQGHQWGQKKNGSASE